MVTKPPKLNKLKINTGVPWDFISGNFLRYGNAFPETQEYAILRSVFR